MSWEQVKDIRARLSRETGAVIKDWGGKLPVALIYPNSYYIGMSNLGVQAIYRFVNERPDAVCERVFWNPGDTEPGLAMESQRPLTDFAVLAFSVSYELDYFNVVQVLKAAGIPLHSKDRDETHPLVIAGGPCLTANPMPLAPFLDAVGIGEAEALLPALLPLMKEGASEDRQTLLKELAKLPGVYVPRHSKDKVTRQFLADLDSFPVHSTVLTRDTELGDMYLLEIQRGCRYGCRFCLVSCAYRPARFRSLENLISQAEAGLKVRRKLGLVGPAVTDHPQIEELVSCLRDMGADISVSSLRIKPLPSMVLGEVVRGGTHTVALAPEAGSQRLRTFIHKGIDEDDILDAVEKTAVQGVKQLKLYFMIGLPTETDEDIEETVRLVTKCKEILDRQRPGSRIVLTISPFVPKAGTPFQRYGMELLPVLKHRLSLLKKNLPSQGISVKNESIEWAEVQAVLSRGDERVGEVLARMENTTLAEWSRVLGEGGLDAGFYAHEKWGAKQALPWRLVNPG
ncbi:MAG: radical SAM protein [Dehalococcoidia bacterium]|nr:radical SAM protein [Dehalococcoidia bacterium]